MAARKANTKHVVEVLLLGQSPLAARYLKHLLRANHKIKARFGANLFLSKADRHFEPSVLIVDEASIPVSQSRYLWLVRVGFPDGALLILGRPINGQDLCRLLMMGVKGYIPYDEVEKDLVCAIDSLTQGRMWVPADILEQFALFVGELTKPKQANRSIFTGREKVVLGLLHRRLSNKEIGLALRISDRTVKFHLEKIFDKLGVRDRHSVAEVIRNTELIGAKAKSFPHPLLV